MVSLMSVITGLKGSPSLLLCCNFLRVSQFLSERVDIFMQKNVNNYMSCANLDFSLFLHPFPGFFLLASLQPCSLAMRLLDDKGVIFGLTMTMSFSVNRITMIISLAVIGVIMVLSLSVNGVAMVHVLGCELSYNDAVIGCEWSYNGSVLVCEWSYKSALWV